MKVLDLEIYMGKMDEKKNYLPSDSQTLRDSSYDLPDKSCIYVLIYEMYFVYALEKDDEVAYCGASILVIPITKRMKTYSCNEEERGYSEGNCQCNVIIRSMKASGNII